MMALADWIEIIDDAGEDSAVTLSPSEAVRMRSDLMAARRTIEDSLILIRRYEDLLTRTRELADKYKDEAAKALDLARRFAALAQNDTFCPAPTEPVSVRWVYRAPTPE